MLTVESYGVISNPNSVKGSAIYERSWPYQGRHE